MVVYYRDELYIGRCPAARELDQSRELGIVSVPFADVVSKLNTS